ncbi:ribonuclease BN [Pseudonocardia sp. KRD-184]|uniref:Ribonuclease BN n=1 Tax=Pseudonocardia oceani TaxID=2792013 RepID=A0ABS6U3A9_9PSEU|nr:halocarboxylic acid dehydrogenase DehI family protein [Pseudonocardia oceani]MBW0091263.1 ribonuclease BN [Pseudonocardia oceani]MBW0098378.1 ribonuclease BN [Pseudonocardia oceani]MBW0110849.1 ribonuclease BN [Pseudonocardia oceani]MBW0119776.1 ribonuclease BN [Pseudonocardia oceani]MBW0126708.1 ribonuclease BN [Pseudonocardia oceani]
MSAGPKFPQVEYADSTGALRRCYDDMQSVLGVPWVMFAARSLAVFGGFVPAAWQAAAPVFATEQVARAADELRGLAVLPGAAPPDPRPRLAQLGFGDAGVAEVRTALDALNHGNARYLLLITAWCEGVQGRSSGGGTSGAALAPARPAAPAAGMAPLHLVDPRDADERVTGLLTRVTDLHLHHGPSSDFRVLARWPDFLEVALDDVLGPVVRTAPYETTALALLDRARAHVRSFPAPAGLSPGQALAVCTEAEVAAVTGLLFLFQRFILDVTIDMVRCAQALDGPSSPLR